MSIITRQFLYTGNIQTYDIPDNGIYKLEVYGGAGGAPMRNGVVYTNEFSYGGYSIGYKPFQKNTRLYIACGGKGTNGAKRNVEGGYNGGGLGTWDNADDEGSGAGGGATHIALVDGTLSSIGKETFDQLGLIVAGGAGGKSYTYASGTGGGISGGDGINGKGGTQTSGYAFGQGQNASGYGDSDGVGGAGGGYYGGYMSATARASSAGGGSGFIGNVENASTRNGINDGNGYAVVSQIVSVINSDNSFGNTTVELNGTNAKVTANANSGYKFLGWYENGSLIITNRIYEFVLSNDRVIEAKFVPDFEITINYEQTLGSASYEWGQGNSVNLSANPFDNAQFKGWFIDDVLISRNLDTTYEVNQDTIFEARFTPIYTIELDYDSDLGSASFTRDSNEQNIIYLSVNSTITQFNGWYINDELISYNQQAQYQITSDSVIEARFEPIWEIDDSVDGDGSIQYERQSTNRNIVSFSVIPDDNRHFVKYEINGEEIFETPYTLTLTQNTTIIAYFEEDDKFHITASANIDKTSVYVSRNDDYAGYTSTLWARPFANYVFDKWSDGVEENPRTISVSQDITLVAEFKHIIETNGIYQYRCFIKDQLNMTDIPKAFMVVDSFDIKQDYLTNANSTIHVLKMADNVNNGDVIVVYNPKGEVIYNGVITSISDLKITTSQMQSFYKGLWIYNNHLSSDYVEDEVAYLLEQYAQGKVYGSSYTDPLIAERLGGITIRHTNSTSGNLPTDLDKDGNAQYTQYDMEKFIYKLYQDYGIVFEFTINQVGDNYVDIKVPTYTSLSIGNNHYSIMNLTPIQKIEETNKLIIYSAKKEYRTTYIATTNGIVEAPTSLANRFNITNTKVVYSDDSVDNLISANLPTQMYNHKISFDLLLKNNLYQFSEFKLGMPLVVWYNGTDYYNSVLTARQFKKNSNQNVSQVSYTCGLVRSTLTNKLSLGKA